MAAYTGLAAATAAVANRFVASVNMANGAYTLAQTTPPWAQGGCLVVATITGVTGNDTPGSITIVGTGLNGQPLTEVLPLVAGGSATSVNPFKTITSITQSGWVINGGNDTIVIGCAAGAIVASGNGVLYGVIVNTTAAGAITLSDSGRTIATLKASIAEGSYNFHALDFAGYLKVNLAAASDITVIANSNPTAA